MAVWLQGLRVKNTSLEMSRGGEQWAFVGAERLPLLCEGCVLRGNGLAVAGRDACVLPCLPSGTAHTSHLSATWLSHGPSVAFHCHQGRCRDSIFIHSSQSVTVPRMACATEDCMVMASASVPRAGLETAAKSD